MSATLVGLAAWAYYLRAGLVLSHYDAKAHLVVARRVIDNLTPGWQQFGAVWLPLPHLLLVLPVQSDLLYRTGTAGSAISLICLGVTVYALARVVRLATGSLAACIAAALLITCNPNVLYLSTTPMTEPLLFALSALVVLWTTEWVASGGDGIPRRLQWALFAATWSRYEAWFVIAGAGTAAALAHLRRGGSIEGALRRLARYAAWPAVATVLFLLDSRVTVGRWFVSDGFFVPDPTLAGQVGRTLEAVVSGTASLSAWALVWTAAAGAVWAGIQGVRARERAGVWTTLALFGTAVLPLAAFFDGHPFRVRYMTPLVVASAVAASLVIGWLPRRVQWVAAPALVGLTLAAAPPLASEAPMVREAQLDRPAGLARQPVSDCLARDYRGEKILASMGSLAHYMQELSAYGLHLRDFVHEGNGVLWEVALEQGPAPHVGWMLVEEQAEGGDVLAMRLRREPAFARGMVAACAGGGVRLYRRASSGV